MCYILTIITMFSMEDLAGAFLVIPLVIFIIITIIIFILTIIILFSVEDLAGSQQFSSFYLIVHLKQGHDLPAK